MPGRTQPCRDAPTRVRAAAVQGRPTCEARPNVRSTTQRAKRDRTGERSEADPRASEASPPRPSLHVGEFVADAPYRQQDPRLRRIRFNAPAQALDQRVDAADGDERVAAPDLRQQ